MNAIPHYNRVVIKIGTHTIAPDGKPDSDYIAQFTAQIAALHAKNMEVIIVTSGAVGMGACELGIAAMPTDIAVRQACAAVGQPLLMQLYHPFFCQHSIDIAQVLVTADTFNVQVSYRNLRTLIDELLKRGIIPIFNENDSIATTELDMSLGDNDRLSAIIATKINAQALIMLSDVDSLYTANPKNNTDARPVHNLDKIDAHTMSTVKNQKQAGKGAHKKAGQKTEQEKLDTSFSSGGMESKLHAGRIARKAGCTVFIAHGRAPNIIERLLNGEKIGTCIPAIESVSERKRWILSTTRRGILHVDQGAIDALYTNKSLLPAGVHKVEGTFDVGDVIGVRLIDSDWIEARLITRISSGNLRKIVRQHTTTSKEILGKTSTGIIARPEEIVLI